MKDDTAVIPLRQPDSFDDPLTEIAREGARRMLAAALRAEADAFVDQFAEALGVDRPTRRDMPQFIENLTTPAITRALMATAFQVSSAKARERLGWSPDYPDIESGLEQTLLSWRATETS